MALYNDTEIALLRRALAAYPGGIDSPDDHASSEYAALARLIDDRLLRAEIHYRESGHGGHRCDVYDDCRITAKGRALLEGLT